MLTGISLLERRSRACFSSVLWLATVVLLPILHLAFHDRPHDHACGMVQVIEVVEHEHDTASGPHLHEGASLDHSNARVVHGHPGQAGAIHAHPPNTSSHTSMAGLP